MGNSKTTIFAVSQLNNRSMKVLKTGAVLKALLDDGWEIVHQKGSHRQLKHPTKKGKVTLNGKPSDDIWGRELKSVEEQSGLVF
ncbi:type II toxin-antitoxin system HicA family toxin [Bacteroides sp.]|uniref:type II toxin-antitoxin system HicA family toxin n=1 Tax=Bacteroides sp. TaxID=29523 RepID=UPI00262E8927|nr:type II toxin-antitoxin system HicA family toxin [Bacteroides sp.]MDD3037896.1 type II toxin-antitoxin system HicA family toxin [Bacteroides sp.]